MKRQMMARAQLVGSESVFTPGCSDISIVSDLIRTLSLKGPGGGKVCQMFSQWKKDLQQTGEERDHRLHSVRETNLEDFGCEI